MTPATSRPSHKNATNFSAVSSIASLQKLGPTLSRRRPPQVRVPPSNQRSLTSTLKLTTRKDSSVHAAATRNTSINVVATLCRHARMTSDLRSGSRWQATWAVGVARQFRRRWSSSCFSKPERMEPESTSRPYSYRSRMARSVRRACLNCSSTFFAVLGCADRFFGPRPPSLAAPEARYYAGSSCDPVTHSNEL